MPPFSSRLPGGQQRVSGHVSLKQTAHFRAQSDIPAFLRSNNASATAKEPPPNSGGSSSLPFHQRSNSENGAANYVAYSPYALRRKELARPFSPPTTRDTITVSEGQPPRPFSPYRQSEQSARDYSGNRCSTNGQSRQETARSFSPYRQHDTNLADGNVRSYSPYRSRYDDRDTSKDRWQDMSRSLSPFARDYSPWRRENVDPPGVIQPPTSSSTCDSGRYSPFLQQRLAQPPPLAPQTHPPQAQDIYGSPMISRKR